MEEIPLELVTITEGDAFSESEQDKKKSKPRPPLVPPKPSKSRMNLVSVPEMSLDQSFVTDDRPSGYNLEFLSPLHPISPELLQNYETVRTPDETGDWRQMLIPSSSILEEESDPIAISKSNSRTKEAIIIIDLFGAGGCPFAKLHHKTPCEFLSLPHPLPEITDEDKNMLLEIDDLSSNVADKIKFIVENLANCGGIWPLMFIEKLNRLIVRNFLALFWHYVNSSRFPIILYLLTFHFR